VEGASKPPPKPLKNQRSAFTTEADILKSRATF
jgi:hypothetical protein